MGTARDHGKISAILRRRCTEENKKKCRVMKPLNGSQDYLLKSEGELFEKIADLICEKRKFTSLT